MRRWITCALMAAATTGAQAQTSFYGITIGQPLAAPECPVEKFLDKWKYAVQIQAVCYEQGGLAFLDLKQGASIANSSVFVKWPTGRGPSLAKGGGMYVRLVDGLVQGIGMGTHGLIAQELVFSELVAKFGQPLRSQTVPGQNAYGAKFESINATWRDGDVLITFEGLLGKIDHGRVTVESPAGAAAEKAHLEQILNTSAKPKM